MQTLLVAFIYAIAVGGAVGALYFFEARWFWHGLSLAAALGLGLAPLPPEWGIPDVAMGAVFLFLFVWGLGLPVFRPHHGHRRTPHHA
jgi:hypothetical protein